MRRIGGWSCLLSVLAVAGVATQPSPAAARREALERACRANNAGAAWLERFEYEKAAAAFQEALRIAPGLGMARFNLALALHYGGRAEQAEREAHAAAAALDSPHGDYLLGLLARARGQHGPAAAAFERVLRRDPVDAAAGIMLGQIRLQQGDANGAVAALQAALALEPHNVTGAYSLSVALSRAGRAEEGRRMLARFQELREIGNGTTLGNGYLEQGRYAEAIVSTGGERDLVDRDPPAVRFAAEPLSTSGYTSRQRSIDPVGRQFDPAGLDPAGRRNIAAAVGGAVALFDFDGDGDLDLLEAAPSSDRLWHNAGGRFTLFAAAALPRRSPAAVTTGFVAGDYDNDGRPDVLVLRYGGAALYRNAGHGRFTNVTARAGLASGATELPITGAFVDVDHDGDLDIVVAGFVDLDVRRTGSAVVFPDGFPAAPTRVWRNNGDGTFADVTAMAGITAGGAVALAATDFDLQRDVDLLIVGRRGLALFKNLRDGSFRDVAREQGLGGTQPVATLAAGDVNRDGRTDFLLSRGGRAALASSHGRNRFVVVADAAGMTGVIAAQLFDYDNDGLLDIMTWTLDGPRVRRSTGDGWQDVADAVPANGGAALALPPLAGNRAVAVGDIDRDGDHDLVVQHRSGVSILRNDGGHRRGALTVRLAAQVSNRSAAGSKVEVRAGSLLQRRETSAATPSPVPHDLVFGLGGRAAADAVRVLWPAGIVQAELDAAAGRPLVVTELNRKPSSCPYLFTWNGTRFEFVTDFLGGGELGYWAAPGVRGHPDPDEHVRLPEGSLRPENGRYQLRVTNELEEVLYLDHLRLIAVTHPEGTEVYPNEGLVSPPFPRAALHVVRNRRPALAAIDDHGHDVRAATVAIDGDAPDDFATSEIRGYAEPHGLTVHVDRFAEVMLLTGWTDYAFSSDNLAASQRGLHLSPPALEVREASRGWRTAIAEIGIPVGRPQTIVVDLRRPELAGHREFRIATNMRVYWDRVAAADSVERGTLASGGPTNLVDVRMLEARLAWRGFSAEVSPDGRGPFTYDYARVSATSPWKTMVGRYTREGEVGPLLAAVDDRFVVARPGDEVSLQFDAASVPPRPPGWTRTYLLFADGFSKEMDVNSASPDQVEPMPFHAMTEYPPAGVSGAPASAGHRSRLVTTPVPSIDALLLPAGRERR